MACRSERIPTEAVIVDALHDAGAACGYDPAACVSAAIDALTPPDASDDAREAISAIVRRAWAVRFDVPGVA